MKAGQEVRFIDVSADAGSGLGMWQETHGEHSGADFTEALRAAVRQFYGTALPPFLEHLTERLAAEPDAFIDGIRDRVEALVGKWLAAVPDAGGQVRSVARRFALVAVGGELATERQITEWPAGAATAGAAECFRAWLKERGTAGAREEAQAVEQLRNFILRHGDSRFMRWHDKNDPAAQAEVDDTQPPVERFRTQNMVGFRRWERNDAGRWLWRYYLTAAGKDEALAGLSPREATRHLAERGFFHGLEEGAVLTKGMLNPVYVIPAHGHIRLYRIADSLLASDREDG